MYRLVVGANNTPEVDWRTEYDRTGGLIAGNFSEGSGTTPTAFGPDYVAITDYSNPIKVVVYSRNTGEEVCNQEVFDVDASATENSLIGYYNTDTSTASIIVENNYGYSLEVDPNDIKPVNRSAPEVTRVDVSGGPGTGTCTIAWDQNHESPSSILKLSTGSGLVYIYEPEYMDNNGNGITTGNEMAWYLTGLNFATGEPEFRTLIGTGKQFNVHYAAISIAPDGTAYAGVLRGLVSVKD